MRIGFVAGYDPTYVWDQPSGTWKRSIQGAPHTVVGGNQLAPTNVVVQFTDYPAESDGRTVGEGDVWVFSDGQLRTGRWIRPNHDQPARYVDANGTPILLRAGPTWVELLPNGAPVDVQFAPPPAATTAPPTTLAPTTTTKAKKK